MLPRTLDELDAIRGQCQKLVTARAGLSAGAAIVPLPGVDLATDTAILLDMLPAINRRFGLSPEQMEEMDPKLKETILVVAASLGSEFVGRMITRQLILRVLKRLGVQISAKGVAKFVPLLGQALAASLSFTLMKMVGNAHIRECYEVSRRLLQPPPLLR